MYREHSCNPCEQHYDFQGARKTVCFTETNALRRDFSPEQFVHGARAFPLFRPNSSSNR